MPAGGPAMKSERGGFRMLRKEQVMQQITDDSYHSDVKLPDPTRCPECDATYLKGQWRRLNAVSCRRQCCRSMERCQRLAPPTPRP